MKLMKKKIILKYSQVIIIIINTSNLIHHGEVKN